MKGRLRVSELFYSIQGESTRAGLPCAFIRLSGCNLRCSWCDSRYTWKETGFVMSLGEIMEWLEEYPGVMVEVTGGEPLLQEAVYPLLDTLSATGRKILLETGGSLGIEQVPVEVGVILDVKCPGSGMAEKNRWQNLEILKERQGLGSRDEVKFVLASEEDFFWAAEIVRERELIPLLPILFSPVTDSLTPERLAALILQERLLVRLQLQLHTQVWPGRKRGV